LEETGLIMNNERTPHILNTSATLLGLCFIVLTSRNVLPEAEITVIDYLTGLAILGFMAACLLSYMSMRKGEKSKWPLETAADSVFIAGLFFLFAATLLIVLNII